MFAQMGATIAGEITAGIGSHMSKKAAEKMARHNAKVAKIKAEASAVAIEARATQQLKARRQQSSQARLALGGRGIDMHSGSPLLVLAEAQADTVADMSELARQAAITREAGDIQSSLLIAEAVAHRNSRYISYVTAGTKGGGQLADVYSTNQQQQQPAPPPQSQYSGYSSYSSQPSPYTAVGGMSEHGSLLA